jgi:hypothetical protein
MGSETPNKNNEIPPQEVISKLGRLSTLLADVKRAVDEYWDVYHQQIDIRVGGTNCFKTLNIQCGNGYSMEFNVNTIYLLLKGPNDSRKILQGGKGSIGDIVNVPLECWDALIRAVENLIREKVNEIEYLRKLYHIYTATF